MMLDPDHQFDVSIRQISVFKRFLQLQVR